MKKLVIAATLALLATGLVAAAGFGADNADRQSQVDRQDRPMDGSNSPWVVQDERLDRFQERFDLTDQQMSELQSEIPEDPSHEEIEETVSSYMESQGIDFEPQGPREESVLRDIGFSRVESGSVSAELLNFLVGEESSDLDDEKEVLDSLREKSRDRLE
ncbi:MAG: hypothetical protein ABEK10_02425 [Candidatus Nanosalina sp.]